MTKNLLIVESPAKAKTIEKIIGKDFVVKSSYGHIRDLAKGNSGIDISNNFTPQYVVSDDKKKVVKELKDIVKKVDDVWLATDGDREGEAISWHLCDVLGLEEKETKRIVFREITKPAIKSAMESPRIIDKDMVNAQQARRVLDRLVGFELSELLWRKIKGRLSAGRVQSVAVKLIVEREREIQKFEAVSFFKINAQFNVVSNGKIYKLDAELPERMPDHDGSEQFMTQCKGAEYTIKDIQTKPSKRKPSAPFTTSTLQQEASRKLGFSVSRTMTSAQRLYEAGHITYMRTDSTNLSEVALESIAGTIEKEYGKDYVQTRRYKSKKQLTQEAHEAIRPSRIECVNASKISDEQRLYELIWKRTISSQMADALIQRTTAKLNISTVSDKTLTAKGEVLQFDGFLKIYRESTDDNNQEEVKGILPPLHIGQSVVLNEMIAKERFTRASPRFTEASLVKQMEELGIGRPSTYAPTISKITEPTRGYIVKESREGSPRTYRIIKLDIKDALEKKSATENTGVEKNKLFPTDMGKIVCDFLNEHFEKVMNYSFTADIEKKFDDIALGKQEWQQIIGNFYKPFHAEVEYTKENVDRVSGERILGKDEASGKTILVRMSRFGPVAQIGAPSELEEEEKPRYANLRPNQSLETVKLEDVIDLFQFPKTLGLFEDKDVVLGQGRYGPYIKYDEKYVNIPKGEEALLVTLERSIELILQKRKEDEPIATYKELPITQGKGRFGPFLKWKDFYVNIPKRFDPATIATSDVLELVQAKEKKEAERYIHRWEDWGLSVQNGRWGPFIKMGKKNINLPKIGDKRMTAEDAIKLTFEDIKALVEEEIPNAFKKKPRKKSTGSKSGTKRKSTPRKKKAPLAPMITKIMVKPKFGR